MFFVCIGMIIMALRYHSYKAHEKEAATKSAASSETKTPPSDTARGDGHVSLAESVLPESSVTEPLG